MNKEQAAKFLGVSVRTLQRLTAEGLFTATTSGPKGAAVYSEDELRQWRDATEAERKELREQTRAFSDGRALSRVTDTTPAGVMTENRVMTVTGDRLDGFARQLAEAVSRAPSIDLAHKLRLTIPEAV